MKKLYALVVLVAVAIFVSCSGSADETPDFTLDDIVNETNKTKLVNQKSDPTNPPDSTYDPFGEGGN